MILDDFAAKIEEDFTSFDGVRFSRGENIFLSTLLEEPSLALGLYEYGVGGGGYTLGGGKRIYEEPRVQIVIRNTPDGYSKARRYLEELINIFDGITDEVFNGTTYMRIEYKGGTVLPPDERYRVRITADFSAMKELSDPNL